MDGHPDTGSMNDDVTAYANLLCIRKKSALRGIVVAGVFAVVSLAAAIAYVWAFRDRTLTSTNVFPLVLFFVYPPVHLAIQGAEYRRLSGLLELIEVLERTARMDPMQSQDQ